LLVSLFLSLTIAKFIRLCEHCFVVVLFFSYVRTGMYTTFEYSVRVFFHMEEQRKPYNFWET